MDRIVRDATLDVLQRIENSAPGKTTGETD
jgi:hypothetical protein